VRFQVLTAAGMKITVFWDAASCSLAEVYRRFRGSFCRHHHCDNARLHDAKTQHVTIFTVTSLTINSGQTNPVY
jgi:hypothetical protein